MSRVFNKFLYIFIDILLFGLIPIRTVQLSGHYPRIIDLSGVKDWDP